MTEKIYPSQLNYLAACPGWLPEPSKGDILIDDNEWSIDGSLCHMAVELGVADEVTPITISIIKDGKRQDYTTTLDAEQVMYVQQALNVCESLRDGDFVEHTEIRVSLPQISGMSTGKVDKLWLYKDTGEGIVLDWKFGRNKQAPAETNLQGAFYALGVAEKYKIVDGKVLFVYPKLGVMDGAGYDAEMLSEWHDKIKAVVSATRNYRDGKLNPCCLSPSDSNCKYCYRLPKCPAMNNEAMTLAAAREPSLINIDWAHPSEMTSPEQVGRALKAAKVLDSWVKSVKKRAADLRFGDGVEIPGYGVAYRKGRRDITDCGAAIVALMDEFDAEVHDFVPAISKLSLPKLEDTLWQIEKTKPKGERLKKKELVELIQRVFAREGVLVQAEETAYLKEEN